MNIKECIFVTTITEECKKELGNDGGFYNGTWTIRVIDYREQQVDLAKNGLCIRRKFSEINDIQLHSTI